MEDTQIIKLFWQRDENAISECQKKYSVYCRFIISGILCDEQDIEEILSDVFLKAWNTIPPARPQSLKCHLGMLSRQLALNRSKQLAAKKRSANCDLILDELGECIANPATGDLIDEIAFRDLINGFLASLPDKTRCMFVARYWYNCSVAQIAKEYRLTQSYVTVLLMRTRKKLKDHLKKESFTV